MKTFFANMNYFHQFFGYFDIFLLQINQWYQHITYDVSIFYLQTTLNRLLNNFITLNWYSRLVLLERPLLKKKKKVPSQNPVLLGLNMGNLSHKPMKFQGYRKGSDCELIRKKVYARKLLSKVGHKVFFSHSES